MNRIIAGLPGHPQGQVPDKYDVMEVLKQTKSSIDPQLYALFAKLLRKFSELFLKSKWDFGKCNLVLHSTDFYRGSKTSRLLNHRTLMQHLKKELRQKIDTFLEHKLITPCHSPYTSAMFLPENGKPRLFNNSGQLKKQLVASCWPLLSIEEVLDTLEKNCCFSPINKS